LTIHVSCIKKTAGDSSFLGGNMQEAALVVGRDDDEYLAQYVKAGELVTIPGRHRIFVVKTESAAEDALGTLKVMAMDEASSHGIYERVLPLLDLLVP
jgi:hypothetical protein